MKCNREGCNYVVYTMPTRKMKVEVSDGEGNRYTIIFNGKITREKAIRLLDIAELIGSLEHTTEFQRDLISRTKFDRTRYIVERNFPLVWFSSSEVYLLYEQEFDEPISLSTISTYLARMVQRGLLVKRGSKHDQRFRILTEISQKVILPVRKNNPVL